MPDTGECRSCHAPILWSMTPKGKRIPLDPEPVDRGNIDIGEDGIARVALVETGKMRHVSHFTTCPDAPQHRRR